MKVKLNGKNIEISKKEDLYEKIEDFRNVTALDINGEKRDLFSIINDGDTIEPIYYGTKEGLDIFWHSSAHIMAQAIMRLYKNVKLAIGPSIAHGFYYDIDSPEMIKEEDFPKIEKEFKKIVKERLRIEREDISRDELLAVYKKENNPYKVEILTNIEDDMVSLYRQGDFFDLCRGPHLPNTSYIKHFKILSVAGAYWHGDEKNKMLQRLYAISFKTKEEVDEYLEILKEAKERDHRKIGKELDLFSIFPEAGPGLVFWKPAGAFMRNLIEDLWKKTHLENDYDLLYTPHVAKKHLWETSGHYEFYKENLFPDMEFPEGEHYLIRPMNCPFHILIFQEKLRSYKELPIRYAELGTVYRYEKSGVLHGLMRVRGFTQDDAHIFCQREDLDEEVKKLLDFSIFFIKKFGFKDFKVYLATRPEKFVGDPATWDQAEKALENAVKEYGIDYEIDEGGGAFYGPKIDIKIKDALGREWQTTTIQFDFNLPERFDINFINDKGEKEHVIMIHRALLGSLERFFGVLIEHYKGDFPYWLAYKQVVILPINDHIKDYAEKINDKLKENGVRSYIDKRNERLGYKIREAKLKKIPYFIVIGETEREENVIKPNGRKEGELGKMSFDEFIEVLEKRKNAED
ncbi:threonine--tRNA ligase [bacterium]|nr:threonine--tRNA ligase [bacterium]